MANKFGLTDEEVKKVADRVAHVLGRIFARRLGYDESAVKTSRLTEAEEKEWRTKGTINGEKYGNFLDRISSSNGVSLTD